MTVLSLENVTKDFGGLRAVNDVSIEIETGQCVALVGPNGSGKTTLLNISTGFLDATSGAIALRGTPLSKGNPAKFAKSGVVRMFQMTRMFPKISVLDNLLVPGFSAGLSRRDALKKARAILNDLGIAQYEDTLAQSLSGGQRKLVEFGACFMLDGDIYMLDEPFAAIHPAIKDIMIAYVRQRSAEGMTFLIVSHDMPIVSGLCPRTVCMANGRVIADGATADVLAHPEVVESYLGGPVA